MVELIFSEGISDISFEGTSIIQCLAITTADFGAAIFSFTILSVIFKDAIKGIV